jgi:hypothetical protein
MMALRATDHVPDVRVDEKDLDRHDRAQLRAPAERLRLDDVERFRAPALERLICADRPRPVETAGLIGRIDRLGAQSGDISKPKTSIEEKAGKEVDKFTLPAPGCP